MTEQKPSWQRSPTSSETPEVNDPPTDATSANGETPQGSSGGKADDIESLKAALKKANAEAAAHRHKAKELDDLKAQMEQEKLTEKERLEKQLATLQAQHETVLRERQERLITSEVKATAATMGIIDPDAAARLVDWTELEYDDSGSPQNVEDVLKALIKKKPYLVGKGGTVSGNGATNPSRSSTSGNKELSWSVISQMTPDEYQNRRGEIMAFMQRNPPRFGTQRH